MKQVIAGIIMFVCAGTLFGMIMDERDCLSHHSAYEIVEFIRQRLLPDHVEGTLITIVGRDEQCRDDKFFSFLFPEDLQQCQKIPKFVFNELFENLDVYEYYRDIFEGVMYKKTEWKGLMSMRHYLTGQIGDKKCPLSSCVDYELYKLGKKFFTILTYLQQKKFHVNSSNSGRFDELYDKCRSTILCDQVRLLLSITYPQKRYDILLFEKVRHLLFLNADLQSDQNAKQNVHNGMFDQTELQIKQDVECLYAESMKNFLKQAIWNKGLDVDDVSGIHFIDLFISFHKSRGYFILYELGLDTIWD